MAAVKVYSLLLVITTYTRDVAITIKQQ
jgi:hypothetical protein